MKEPGQRIAEASGVKRFDAGKSRVELIEPRALEELGLVCAWGAERYGEHNWLNGMRWSRMIGSAARHLLAIMRGEDVDPETGRLHAAHLMWNAMGLTSYKLLNLGEDDRFKVKGVSYEKADEESADEKADEESAREETGKKAGEESPEVRAARGVLWSAQNKVARLQRVLRVHQKTPEIASDLAAAEEQVRLALYKLVQALGARND